MTEGEVEREVGQHAEANDEGCQREPKIAPKKGHRGVSAQTNLFPIYVEEM